MTDIIISSITVANRISVFLITCQLRSDSLFEVHQMADRLFSLWSDQIKKDVLSPKAILNMQAKVVSNITGGILQGEVRQAAEPGEKVTLSFYLVVPALHDYRHQIMKIAHRKDLPYPAVVQAEIF